MDVTGTVHALEERIYADKDSCKKATGLKIAVMGWAVNGPGEARDADLGIAGGKGEGLYFEKGQTMFKLPAGKWVDFLVEKNQSYKKIKHFRNQGLALRPEFYHIRPQNGTKRK